MKPMKNIALGTILFLLTWLINSLHGAVTTSSTFPSDLSKLTFIGDSVYVGGADSVFKLHRLDLKVVNSKPINTPVPQCGGQSCPSPAASSEVTYLGPLNSTDLLLCSSAYGQCELHKLSDLSWTSSSEGLITTNRNSGTVVAAVASFNASITNALWIASSNFTNTVPDKESFAISARHLNFDLVYYKGRGLFGLTVEYSAQPYHPTTPDVDIQYLHAFSHNGIRFFVRRRTSYSTISGICENDKIFTSLIELKLECDGKKDITSASTTKPGASLNTVSGEAVTTDDLLLFAAFGMSDSSSVCAFSVKKIIQELDNTFRKCHNQRNGDVTLGPEEFRKDTTSCSTLTVVTLDETLSYCEIFLGSWTRTADRPLINNIPLLGQALLSINKPVLAMIIDTVSKHTVAYMVTGATTVDKGLLSTDKVNAKIYQTIDLASQMSPGQALKQSMAANGGDIYVLSRDKVFRIEPQCSMATDCESCRKFNDPACGWCSLSQSCTVSSQCENSQQEGYWVQKCTNATIVGSKDFSVESNQFSNDDTFKYQLKVSMETMPSSDHGYQCCFLSGSNRICTSAVKKSQTTQSGTSLILECNTPEKKYLRDRIPENEDHISGRVEFVLLGSTFESLPITFFDCSKQSSCTGCTKTSFQCNWCLTSLTCSFNKTSCNADDTIYYMNNMADGKAAGPSQCPQFVGHLGSTAILIPSGVRRSFSVDLFMKPTYYKDFRCELDYEDRTEEIPALLASPSSINTTLSCNFTYYLNYTGPTGIKTLPFRVSVTTNDGRADKKYFDNRDNLSVELYKCEPMSTDGCGTCFDIDEKYKCGWCQPATSKSTCQVKELCDTDLLKPEVGCPDNEITEIKPLNGSIQGGTLLTIIGRQLGLNYRDRRDNVFIKMSRSNAQVKCLVNESEPFDSSIIVCRMEMPESTGEGNVNITFASGRQVSSTQKFTFYNPIVESLSFSKGPIAGGSQITIIGDKINIGATQKVAIRLFAGGGLKTEYMAYPGKDSNSVFFTTPRVAEPQSVTVSLIIDGNEIISNRLYFEYRNNSVIKDLVPKKGILSGGTMVNVTGTSLDVIQAPKMYFQVSKPVARRKRRSILKRAVSEDNQRVFSECGNATDTLMVCIVPNMTQWMKDNGNPEALDYGFLMDNIQETLNLTSDPRFEKFTIVPDPVFKTFGKVTISTSFNNDAPLAIKGENLLALGGQDVVQPMIKIDLRDGSNVKDCVVKSIQENDLYCEYPAMDESVEYKVVIHYGRYLEQELGVVVRKDSSFSFTTEQIVGIAVGAGAFVALLIIIFCCTWRRYKNRSETEMKKFKAKMDNLEMEVAKECKEAFTELQTDMTELTQDIQALHGLPFYEYNQYCTNVLFPVSEGEHTILSQFQVNTQAGNGLREFHKLLLNKTFLLAFVRTLEQQHRKFAMRDRVELGSYLSVLLQGNMEYHTDILKTLLSDLIERNIESSSSPKVLFRRNESVAEKMLANWFAFLLHKFLRECAGEPLYLLYRAIKQQVDKGPVDAVTGEAKYSLSEDKLLRQAIEFQQLTLRFISPDGHAAQDPQLVKVLNCDTISQAIEKILDTLYRNVPYSSNISERKDTLILEWIKPNRESVVMFDEDPQFSKTEGDSRRVATLASYKITDNAAVRFTKKHFGIPHDNKSSLNRHVSSRKLISYKIYDYMVSSLPWSTSDDDLMSNYTTNSSSNGHYQWSSTGDSLSRANSSNNILDTSSASARIPRYHLVKTTDLETQVEGERSKMVSEIYLTRLLATKGVLQQFVDDLFETIFSTSHRGSALPLAIKYMFDFLDDQAIQHNIFHQEVIHIWKSNCLPLRFWVNVIKNPDFVFDIHKSQTVDASLSVVAQIFMESCSLSEVKLGKDSPSSKLLYAKDIPKYQRWVARYYSDIKSMPAISDQDMNAVLMEESKQHRNEFNFTATLFELFQYVLNYQAEILEALREDEFARKDHLAESLERVIQQLRLSNSTRM